MECPYAKDFLDLTEKHSLYGIWNAGAFSLIGNKEETLSKEIFKCPEVEIDQVAVHMVAGSATRKVIRKQRDADGAKARAAAAVVIMKGVVQVARHVAVVKAGGLAIRKAIRKQHSVDEADGM
jgi:hypothetical protein